MALIMLIKALHLSFAVKTPVFKAFLKLGVFR